MRHRSHARQLQNDQLGAYYPDGGRHPFRSVVQGTAASLEPGDSVESAEVTLGFRSAVVPGQPTVTVLYSLTDGDPFLQVDTVHANDGDKPVHVLLFD